MPVHIAYGRCGDGIVCNVTPILQAPKKFRLQADGFQPLTALREGPNGID